MNGGDCMTLFLVEVIGVILTVLALPVCCLIFSLKSALESEKLNISNPVPIDELTGVRDHVM